MSGLMYIHVIRKRRYFGSPLGHLIESRRSLRFRAFRYECVDLGGSPAGECKVCGRVACKTK